MDFDYLRSPTRLGHHHIACTKCIHLSQEKSFHKELAHYDFLQESRHHLYLRLWSWCRTLLRRIHSMLKCCYNNLSQKYLTQKSLFELTACVATNDIIFDQYCTITIVARRTISAKSFSPIGSLTANTSDATFPSGPPGKT